MLLHVFFNMVSEREGWESSTTDTKSERWSKDEHHLSNNRNMDKAMGTCSLSIEKGNRRNYAYCRTKCASIWLGIDIGVISLNKWGRPKCDTEKLSCLGAGGKQSNVLLHVQCRWLATQPHPRHQDIKGSVGESQRDIAANTTTRSCSLGKSSIMSDRKTSQWLIILPESRRFATPSPPSMWPSRSKKWCRSSLAD